MICIIETKLGVDELDAKVTKMANKINLIAEAMNVPQAPPAYEEQCYSNNTPGDTEWQSFERGGPFSPPLRPTTRDQLPGRIASPARAGHTRSRVRPINSVAQTRFNWSLIFSTRPKQDFLIMRKRLHRMDPANFGRSGGRMGVFSSVQAS